MVPLERTRSLLFARNECFCFGRILVLLFEKTFELWLKKQTLVSVVTVVNSGYEVIEGGTHRYRAGYQDSEI